MRATIPGETEPLGPIKRPLPKLVIPKRPHNHSLRTVSEQTSESPARSATASASQKLGGEQATHSHAGADQPMRSMENPVFNLQRSSVELRHSPAHSMCGNIVQAGSSEGECSKSSSRAPFILSGTSQRGMPGTGGASASVGGQCDGTEEQGYGAQVGNYGEGCGESEKAGRAVLRRSRSLPSCHEEGERGEHQQPSSGSHVLNRSSDASRQSGGRGASSRQEGGPCLDGTQGGSVGVWLPLAPQQLSRSADTQPVAEARHPRPDTAPGRRRNAKHHCLF